MMIKKWITGLAFGILVCGAASATGITNTQIDGDRVVAQLELPGGIEAQLTLSFEQVVGLTAENLGLSASLISPTDPLVLAQLPPGVGAVPSAFPVLISIDPPAGSPLSFSGTVYFEIYTHNLPYVPGTQLRLFSGPLGGALHDVTARTSAGSYRVGADQPSFTNSNLIVLDPRPLTEVIDLKQIRLEDVLDTNISLVAPPLFAALSKQVDEVRKAYVAGATVDAIGAVEEFIGMVQANAGNGLPDVWSAGGSGVNVAGELIQSASTLRYSLIEKSNGLY